MTTTKFGGAAPRAAATPRVTAWSFSRLKDYTLCPFKLKCTAIDRLPITESEAMLEGKRIHTLAEQFLNGEIDEVPKELELFGDDYANLREHSRENPGAVKAEMQLAFRADFTPCSWFAKDTWLRVIYDAVANDGENVYINDLKTGKPRPEDTDQLELFAMTAFLAYPEAMTVRCELWYSKGGQLKGADYHRSQFEKLRDKWVAKAAPMLADEEFLPTPNPLCKWCDFRKSNNGPCKFS